ncbi:LOW QUALITY PROTEIN: Mic1 domain-containing protein, partial [Cephalotus follicularis]
GSLPIYSSKIVVSVVDNVILVHQVDAKVVILYDIFSYSRAPIFAPLPLLLRGIPRSSSSSFLSISRDSESSETNKTGDHEAVIYGDDWTFLVPDLICDVANNLWKIQLDLEASIAISAISSDVPSVLEFLQRLKLEANEILEPSKEVALQLLSGRQNFQTRKLVLHMLRQLSLHEDYVLLLVQEGYYQEALRYARKHKVNFPSQF